MPIQSIFVLLKDDAEAQTWRSLFRKRGHNGLTNLLIERVFWLEGEVDLIKLFPLFANPVYQVASMRSQLDPARGPIIEIAYRPAVTDPETPSILAGAWALGQRGLDFARLGKRYQFIGIEAAEAQQIAARFLYNKVVQRIRGANEPLSTLRPSGNPSPVATISLGSLTDEELQALSGERSWYAPLSQMKVIQAHERAQGHPHTDAEIEILAQTWSDHCYHTTWKSLGLLKKLSKATADIHHPLVVSAFEDNAGGMEFFDDWVISIKGETHNFPSSIAPFGGVSTKHGGVIRDTLGFGKGGYPIGGTTLMGTMDPRLPEDEVPPGALHPQLILTESIRATAYYCNPMGIPMAHLAYRFHPGYAKCLALGHSIGMIPKRHTLKEDVQPSDRALLVGGKTGRDGIHGATASSTGMTGETLNRESAAVQIGHPITEREFASAIPVLRDAGCIRAITDLGAGGISCAAGEMGAETGVDLDLDAVPLKDQSMTAWEILLSESQERMLIAVPPEKLAQAQNILDRYDVKHAVIGNFTDSGRLTAAWHGQNVANIEMSFLWGACPLDPIPIAEPKCQHESLRIPEPTTPEDWSAAIGRVLTHAHCADQSGAGSQFDTTVQGRTVVGPYGGKNQRMPTGISVLAPLRDKPYGVITTVAFNPFYGDISPATMAKLMVIEAITKAVVAGGDYREMVLCDNFYTPRVRPEIAWDLKQMVEAIVQLSVEFRTPFISGKDSSSGTLESEGRKIEAPMTLVVSALGRIRDISHVVTKEFKRAGNRLALVGVIRPDALGGSVYADSYGQRGDRLPEPLEAATMRAIWDRLIGLGAHGKYVSGCAIAEGGLFLRLFEASLGSGLGASLDLSSFLEPSASVSSPKPRIRADELLFGEFIGSVLLEIPLELNLSKMLEGVPFYPIGEVLSDARLTVAANGKTLLDESVTELAAEWANPFREMLE